MIALVGHASMQRVQRATMVRDRRVGLELQVEHHLRKEKVAARVLVEQQAVLSNPTQTRTLRPSPLQDRCAVHTLDRLPSPHSARIHFNSSLSFHLSTKW